MGDLVACRGLGLVSRLIIVIMEKMETTIVHRV